MRRVAMTKPRDVRLMITQSLNAHAKGQISDNALKARCTAGNTILSCFEAEGIGFKAECHRESLDTLKREGAAMMNWLERSDSTCFPGSSQVFWVEDADGNFWQEDFETGEYSKPYNGPMNEWGKPSIPRTRAELVAREKTEERWIVGHGQDE